MPRLILYELFLQKITSKETKLRPKPPEIFFFTSRIFFARGRQKELWPWIRNRQQHRILYGNRCHIPVENDAPRHEKRFFSLQPCRLRPYSDAMVAQTRVHDTAGKKKTGDILTRRVRALIRRWRRGTVANDIARLGYEMIRGLNFERRVRL